MKLDLTKILLVAAVAFIGWQNFFRSEPEPDPKPVEVVIPSVQGSSGEIELEPEIIRDTVYIKGDTIQVDKGYKEMYEGAVDSLARLNVFLDAIKIRDYEGVLVDNNDILITGNASTMGKLLKYSVEYNIKEKKFEYVPEVVKQLPRLSVGVGIETGVPLSPQGIFTVKGNLSLINNKGQKVNLGYDSNKVVWIGYEKIFKIIK